MREEELIKVGQSTYEKASERALDELLYLIGAGEKRLRLGGLAGGSKYFLLRKISLETKRPILFIIPGEDRLEEARRNLVYYFGPDLPALLCRNEPEEDLLTSVAPTNTSRPGWFARAKSAPLLIGEAPALAEKTMPKRIFFEHSITLRLGDRMPRDELTRRLREMGYLATSFVEAHGEMSVRGGIVDVFPPGMEHPIRVEMLGDEVCSLRLFSAADQKSIGKIESAFITPASEVVLSEDSIARALSYIRQRAQEEGIPARAKYELLEQIERRERIGGVEWLLPAFYAELGSPLDFIPPETLLIFDEPLEVERRLTARTGALSETAPRVRASLKVAPRASELFLDTENLKGKFAQFQSLVIEDLGIEEEGKVVLFQTSRIEKPDKPYETPFDFVEDFIGEWRDEGYRVLITAPTEMEKRKFEQILTERGIKGVEIDAGTLDAGFVFHEERLAHLTESDIFGQKKKGAPRIQSIPSAFLTSFSELKPGDYIVHREVGIGIFRGLRRLKFGEVESDFMECEYEGGDKIYVPVHNLKLVHRYIGDGRHTPKLDKLGHPGWQKVVRRVRRAAEGMARELIELYARRKSQKGFSFSKRDKMFREFELSFPYEETPDQEAAINDVMADMESDMPMDRLICGDVGFGKTEVAVRAAFKAVLDGKQVAVLVPTTLLAFQHYTTFANRLRGYAVGLELLSRWRSTKEINESLAKLREGKTDIAIGTHMLLGERVKFKDLGLVIIDEEQRFGVRHKEKLKQLKGNVDVLTLSATPIPRTLEMSLAGIRDISIINTPPEGRQTVETRIVRFSEGAIRDAISMELERGGSVFFVHNRIHDIFGYADLIRRLVPEAKVEVTHGRMKERDVEERISRFIKGETNVLVTTAIVESGLDIPRANTIIVDEAHTFGLADLYQLRGRVGRSTVKAYAYFLIPQGEILSEHARRRLKAIVELKELGSGFKLALSDLEIRGAGNIFGKEQSGHIAEVGLEMYLEMLDAAIRKLKPEGAKFEYEPEIKSPFPSLLPDDYITDGAERLLFYKRISGATTQSHVDEIRQELRDRFGELPVEARNLLDTMELKLLMKRLLVKSIEIRRREAVIIFHERSPLFQRFSPRGVCKLYMESLSEPAQVTKRLAELFGKSQEATSNNAQNKEKPLWRN
jgi:transcription-repair coupling factor (superfamily II helicase)